MTIEKLTSPILKVRVTQEAVAKVMQEARQLLIDRGQSLQQADTIVKTNFNRINNSGLILNIDELCKLP